MTTPADPIRLAHLLDALEAELIAMPDAEIVAVAKQSGMAAGALLSDVRAAIGGRSYLTHLMRAAQRKIEEQKNGDSTPPFPNNPPTDRLR